MCAVGLWPFPLYLQWAAVSIVLEVRSGCFHCICKGTLAISIVFTVRLAVSIVFAVGLAVSVVFTVKLAVSIVFAAGLTVSIVFTVRLAVSIGLVISNVFAVGIWPFPLLFVVRFWSFPLYLQWVSGPFHCICSGTVRFHHTCMQCMCVGVIMTCPAVA